MKYQDYAPVTRRIVVPNPAAGTNWTRTADKGAMWLVRGVTFQLVTAVAAATRVVGLSLVEGDDTRFVTAAATGQIASLTRRYSAYPGSAPGVDSTVAISVGWPHDGLIMPVGTTLSSVTDAIQAADQYQAIVLDVLEYAPTFPAWLMPSVGHFVYDMSESAASPEGY